MKDTTKAFLFALALIAGSLSAGCYLATIGCYKLALAPLLLPVLVNIKAEDK